MSVNMQGSTQSQAIPSQASRRAASRKNRVHVFRDFIKTMYSLSPGSVVLDMAGGKGDLSWLLCNIDGVNSVVVDPRITRSHHILRSIKFLRENPQQAKERSIPGLPTYQPLAALMPQLEEMAEFQTPRHLRLFVDEKLVSAVKERLENPENIDQWHAYFENATNRAESATPLGFEEKVTESKENPTIQDPSIALETILKAELVLGFHPDQATEPAMDLAELLGIPYCVVPCCVFPQDFPNRKLPDGKWVKKYLEMVEYLQHKYNPHTSKLPFHFTETAKNLVMYSLRGLQTTRKETKNEGSEWCS